jgi:hypothetical protein
MALQLREDTYRPGRVTRITAALPPADPNPTIVPRARIPRTVVHVLSPEAIKRF